MLKIYNGYELEMIADNTQWLVEGLICKNQLTILYGKRKSGKSTFLGCLADALSTGKEFIGRQTTKSNVLYWTFEESIRTVRLRLVECNLSRTLYWCFDRTKVNAENQTEMLRQAISEGKIDLVIIDAAARAFSFENEWMQENVSKAIEPLLKVRDDLNVAIIIVAHGNKADTSVNGSVQFEAIADNIIHYSSSADRKTINLSWEGRLDVGIGSAKLKSDGGVYSVISSGHQEPNEAGLKLSSSEQKVLKALAKPSTVLQIVDLASLSERTVRDCLSTLNEKGKAAECGKSGKAKLWHRAA